MINPARTWIALALLLAPAAGAAQQPNLAARVDSFVAPLVKSGELSGVILIGTPDSILLVRAWGMADYDRKIPNTPETEFLIASVTKTFTAAAIVVLEQEGALGFDDPLANFVPDFPHGKVITVEQLLSHASGVANPDYLESFSTRATLEDLVDRIKSQPLLFDPGTDHRYSNAGYNLLAYVIQKASGKSYDEFLRERFFQPLGMTHTGNFGNDKPMKGRAVGHLRRPSPRKPAKAPWFDPGFSTGSGSLWSTAGDLYRWGRATHAKQFYDPLGLYFPFGWGRLDVDGHSGIWQTGATTGFVSSLSVFDEGPIVVLLANVENGGWVDWTNTLGRIALGLPFEVPAPQAPPVALDRKSYRRYLGTYASDQWTFEVLERDGNLWIHVPGWPTGKYLEAISDTEFRPLGDAGSVVFGNEQGGTFQDLVWRFGRGGTTYHRTALAK